MMVAYTKTDATPFQNRLKTMRDEEKSEPAENRRRDDDPSTGGALHRDASRRVLEGNLIARDGGFGLRVQVRGFGVVLHGG